MPGKMWWDQSLLVTPRNLFIKNQVLYVSLSSSVIRQELMMGREMLIRNLNAQVGSQVIVNIVFR